MIGAGAAGTWVARAMKQGRPDWSITLFERGHRIGGRLRSVHVPGLDHPIELGGMRYLTSHRRVQALFTELGIETRPFDVHGGTERSYLRGVFGHGPSDPTAGTDGRHTQPIVALAGGASNGEPAPRALIDAVLAQLRTIHPAARVPEPKGSAFMHWGSDPLEIGWTYWLAGSNPDDVIPAALQPDPSLPIYVCGEGFSRAQAWVEGALETAEQVVARSLQAQWGATS